MCAVFPGQITAEIQFHHLTSRYGRGFLHPWGIYQLAIRGRQIHHVRIPSQHVNILLGLTGLAGARGRGLRLFHI